MKKKPSSVISLTIRYYTNVIAEKMWAVAYNIEFAAKNKRLARKMSKDQFERFEKFLNNKKNGRD